MVTKKKQEQEIAERAMILLTSADDLSVFSFELRVPHDRVVAWAEGTKKLPKREAQLICDAQERSTLIDDMGPDFYMDEPPTAGSLIEESPIAVRELEEAYVIATKTNSPALPHLQRALEEMDYPAPHVI